MYLFLLKKALPFTLTFVVGTALGGLTWLFGSAEKRQVETALVTRTYDFKGRCGSVRRHRLVAETKPLAILFKPAVSYPAGREAAGGDAAWARVKVTFGAEGTVTDVRPLGVSSKGPGEIHVSENAVWEAVESAARRIEFTPETVDGVPVSVTRVIEMEFAPGSR